MKVNLDEVINCIESSSSEYTYVYVIEEERIVPLESRNVESWPYEDDEIIVLPDRDDIDDYGNMERFIQRVDDETIREWLSNAIRGRGAFRMFRATLERFHMLNEWYDYRDRCHRVCAMDWCEENGIEYEGARYEIDDDYDDDYEDEDDWQTESVTKPVQAEVRPEYKVIAISKRNVNQLVFLASEFIDEQLEKHGYAKQDDPDEAISKLEQMIADGALIHAVSDHGRYVGYSIVKDDKERFRLDEIFVRKQLRRKGLGRMLMNQMEDDAKEAEKPVQLDVDPADSDTIAFLRKCGYTVLSSITLEKNDQKQTGNMTELNGLPFSLK